MISPAVLERPGYWRASGLIVVLGLVVSPTAALFWQTFETPPTEWSLGTAFLNSLGRSLLVATATAASALALGLPCGLLAGLYRFPGRRFLLGALALPLLMPSFLWAIGLSMLRVELGLPRDSILSGAVGVVWSFAALATPLVVFGVFLAIRMLPANAVDAARLAGGERAVLRYAARAALPAGLAAALLGGVISLTDPGPGQILGFSGVGSEILVSFSALYDFELAGQQGLSVGVVVLLTAVPLIWFTARRLTLSLLSRGIRLVQPGAVPAMDWIGPAVLGAVLLTTLLAPVAGLLGPALTEFEPGSVLTAVERTGMNTLYYGLVAGVVATACAVSLAVCAARVAALRAAVLGCVLLMLLLPPAVGALGTVLVASESQAALDPILRSRFTVAAVLGLRLTGIAAVVLLRAVGSAPASWAWAAAAHGVPLTTYARRVLAPFLVGPVLMSVALVALVATADVTTVLLLQPPGQDSLPVALFTVMANAPESVVASLCMTYLVLGGCAVVVLMAFGGPPRKRSAAGTSR